MSIVSVIKGGNPSKILQDAISLHGGVSTILPNKSEKILIKPNFGCHKTATTGATTDLRVLGSLIEMLQNEGFSNITIGDGGMAGYIRVNILKYLGVSALCQKYGVKVLDLNRDDSVLVKLISGASVRISKTALRSKVINLAKLKTHVLTTVTLGIKNLLGCVVGFDKREVHLHGLHESLASLPSIMKPRFTIIEGLIGMEGRGPVAGKPVKADVIIASEDVVAADIVASKIIGFDPFSIRHIKNAADLASGPHNMKEIKIVGTSLKSAITPFEKATPKGLEANLYVNKMKHMLRGKHPSRPAYALLSSNVVSTLLRNLGILQEEIDRMLPKQPPKVDKNICKGCDFCKNVCPTDAILVAGRADINPDKCIKCYCCVEICPHSAIT